VRKTLFWCSREQTRDTLQKKSALIQRVASEADVEIILAFKAYALWKTFPIFREYISSTTASSLGEAMLAFHEFGARAHTYSPAYTDYEIDDIARCSSHLTFNSLPQYSRSCSARWNRLSSPHNRPSGRRWHMPSWK
jgi:diaminopimelate decarboxylase